MEYDYSYGEVMYLLGALSFHCYGHYLVPVLADVVLVQ